MRSGITSAFGWTLRMASLAALYSCWPPSQFCGEEVGRAVSQRRDGAERIFFVERAAG